MASEGTVTPELANVAHPPAWVCVPGYYRQMEGYHSLQCVAVSN
jgi:hypothetical protein